jgi:hypothetical protein
MLTRRDFLSSSAVALGALAGGCSSREPGAPGTDAGAISCDAFVYGSTRPSRKINDGMSRASTRKPFRGC